MIFLLRREPANAIIRLFFFLTMSIYRTRVHEKMAFGYIILQCENAQKYLFLFGYPFFVDLGSCSVSGFLLRLFLHLRITIRHSNKQKTKTKTNFLHLYSNQYVLFVLTATSSFSKIFDGKFSKIQSIVRKPLKFPLI